MNERGQSKICEEGTELGVGTQTVGMGGWSDIITPREGGVERHGPEIGGSRNRDQGPGEGRIKEQAPRARGREWGWLKPKGKKRAVMDCPGVSRFNSSRNQILLKISITLMIFSILHRFHPKTAQQLLHQ